MPEVLAFVINLGQIHWATFFVGLICLAALFLMHRYTPKIPAALTVMVLAIVASYLLDFEDSGIHIVGEIPAGLPPIGLPTGVGARDALALIPGAAAIALVAFAESVAVARSYATKFNYRVEADQELIAVGASNAGSGFSGGFVVDGSLSKTAASVDAGATSQMVSIIAGIAVLITAVFLTPLFYYLPEAALAAIVIHAVWHLINYRKISQYWGVTDLDFWTALVAVVGVLAIGILQGIVLALCLGLFGLVLAAKSRKSSVMGKVPGEETFRSLEHFPDGETYPGLLILRFDGALFFANAPDFADEVREGVALYDPKVVLVDGEAITDIDATAIMTIHELKNELERVGIELRFARIQSSIQEIMKRLNTHNVIDSDRIYVSVRAGVEAYLAESQESDDDDQ